MRRAVRTRGQPWGAWAARSAPSGSACGGSVLAGSPAGSSLLLSHRFLGFSFPFAVPPELRDLLSGSRGGCGTCWYFDEASGAFINELRNSGSRGIHASLRNRPDVVLGVATAILAHGSVAWFRGAAPWAGGCPAAGLRWGHWCGCGLLAPTRGWGSAAVGPICHRPPLLSGDAVRPQLWGEPRGQPGRQGRGVDPTSVGGLVRGHTQEADGRHLSHRVFRVFSSISHLFGCAFLVGLHLFLLSRPLASCHVRCQHPRGLSSAGPSASVCFRGRVPKGCLDTARGRHGVSDRERPPHRL